MITKTQYYQHMCRDFAKKRLSFPKIHEMWFKCFEYTLRNFKVGFRKETIVSLFYNWEMANWAAMWLENSEYKNFTRDQLKQEFIGELAYCCDRMSYDRLFRSHWLFRKCYDNELCAYTCTHKDLGF